MIPEKIIYTFFCLFGLYLAVRFKHVGQSTIESRKKIEQLIEGAQSQKHFTEKDVTIGQYASLIIGILFFLLGLAKLVNII